MAKEKKPGGSKEPKGYRKKRLLGLVPHVYDKHSKSFLAGAWKNLEPHDLHANRRALGLHGDA